MKATQPQKTSLRGLALAITLGAAFAAQAASVDFAPVLPGQYAAGDGVDATFLKVFDDWHGSTGLWNEDAGEFGSGVEIGSLHWGTGLWALSDWKTANLNRPAGMIESVLTTHVGQISFADDRYNDDYGLTWGEVALAPLFAQPTPPSTQDNWTSHVSGYIRIVEAGDYNFGVLHDDGFFFNLTGAGGSTLSLSDDYLNPRERHGFDTDLALQPGLYAFELGGFDRLEAGVLELSWSVAGGAWEVIPTPHLVANPLPVPEPESAALLALGLLALPVLARRRAARPRG